MRERGRYQLQLMKTRSSSGVGQKIELEFNIDSLRIIDIEDEDEIVTRPSAGSSLLNSIKQRTTITPDEPKVKGVVASSRIRDLLNKMGSDDM